jgi:hypothetical protein
MRSRPTRVRGRHTRAHVKERERPKADREERAMSLWRGKPGRGKKGILSATFLGGPRQPAGVAALLALRPSSSCAPHGRLDAPVASAPHSCNALLNSLMHQFGKRAPRPTVHCALHSAIYAHLLIERRGGVGCISCETVEQRDELCCRAVHVRVVSPRRGVLI